MPHAVVGMSINDECLYWLNIKPFNNFKYVSEYDLARNVPLPFATRYNLSFPLSQRNWYWRIFKPTVLIKCWRHSIGLYDFINTLYLFFMSFFPYIHRYLLTLGVSSRTEADWRKFDRFYCCKEEETINGFEISKYGWILACMTFVLLNTRHM